MKRSPLLPAVLSRPQSALKLLSVIALCVLTQSPAATLYWDTNGSTAGAGTTPSGTWAASGTTFSASAAGTSSISATTTTLKDDLYFSAGTDAAGPYAVTLTNTQNARLLIIEEGTPTFTGGTLSLAASSGGITVNAGTGATVSSNITISGSQILNAAAGTTLTLDTGTFTRNAGASLNVLTTGTVTTTQTGLNAGSLVNGIIGTWATYGTGSATRYATINSGTNAITSLTGTAAATAAALTDTTGAVNYDLAAATGSTPASVSANTIRYTGAAATTAPGATLFSVNGLMNAGSGTWTIGTNALTIGANRELVVNPASASITISSVIQDNAAGASALTKIGANSLTLTGANTYTGVTYISQGSVTITNSSGLGSTLGNTVINSNGSTTTGGALYLSGGITIAEDIVITGPGDGIAANYNGAIASTNGTNTITGTLTLTGSNSYRLGANSGTVLNLGLIQRTGTDSASIVFSASSGGTINVTQAIKNNNGGITVHAGGTAILSASNNEIGAAVVQNGSTLKIAANNALNIAQNLQVGNSSGNTSTGLNNDVGTFFIEGVTQTISALNGYANGGTSPNNATTTDRRVITSGSALNSTLIVGNGNVNGSFDGVIENGSAGGTIAFTKVGTAIQTLTGTVANTYTGDTTVNGGILVLAKTAGINAVAGNLIIGDGTGSAGNDIVWLTNSNQIADTSIVTLNGTGTNAGILRLNNQSETIGGLSSTGGGGIVENESGSAATSTLAVNVAPATTQSYSGTLRNGDGSGTDGTLAFEKNGTGTQILTGASTYTGGTTVNAGTLQVNNTNGSATGSGPVLVTSAATLGGTGIITLGTGNRATIQGTLSPGSAASPVESIEFSIASGIGASTSGITFSGSTLAFDLGLAGSSLAAVGTSDTLLITGTLNEATDITFTGSNVFDFGGTGTAGWYKLVDTAAASGFNWTGLTVDANGLITGGLAYTNLAGGLTGSFYLGNGSTSGDYGDIYFQVTPEPGRALLLFGGMMAMAFRRRRR